MDWFITPSDITSASSTDQKLTVAWYFKAKKQQSWINYKIPCKFCGSTIHSQFSMEETAYIRWK